MLFRPVSYSDGSFDADLQVTPSLAKDISDERWVDLEKAFATGRGEVPAPTCRFQQDGVHGTRRDLSLVCPSALSPLTWKRSLLTLVRRDFHIFVADVFKSFDTVDRDMLHCPLGWQGLPAWLQSIYFAFQQEVRLRCKLATRLGTAWTREEGIPQDALSVWSSLLHFMPPGVGTWRVLKALTPQQCAENLQCNSCDAESLLSAAQYTVSHVKVVGQELLRVNAFCLARLKLPVSV